MDYTFAVTGVGAGRFAQMYGDNTNNRSFYDGINIQLRKRMSKHIMFQASDVGLDFGGIDLDSGNQRQSFRQKFRVGVVLFQLGRALSPAQSVRQRPEFPPAACRLPAPCDRCGRDRSVGLTHQHRSHRCAEAF